MDGQSGGDTGRLPRLWLRRRACGLLLPANVLASAAVPLLWLLADACSRAWKSWPPLKHTLLGIQSLLGLTVGALLLLGPLTYLVAEPAQPLASFVRVEQPLGWLPWLLAAASAGICCPGWPGLVVSLLGVSGLCLGMLAALTAERWPGTPWRGYHVDDLLGGTRRRAAVLSLLRERVNGGRQSPCAGGWEGWGWSWLSWECAVAGPTRCGRSPRPVRCCWRR